eukprot:CAMPEP_0175028308 /NCGR_PEP_ID=MMETSP0005-20121125/18921_1 /TAXON_ID=420556 /ORGANISM="Ochromonas sp., Strain CCMP1393" /LENGTH=219 /DNA_ID=CAMNT_0016287899 /DNA_START=17 /DNA_END=672 /DNA_ORIENTATION=+
MIVVPTKCFQNNPKIGNIFDLHGVLGSLRYWLVRNLPDSVISFALNENNRDAFRIVAEEFWNDMPQLHVLHNVSRKGIEGVSEQIIYALEDDAPCEVLQYLFKHCHETLGASKLRKRVADTVARLGALEYLQYIIDEEEALDYHVCEEAAKGGHLVCLKYAREHSCCSWNATTCISAALRGHLDCLKYAHEQGCPWNQNTCSVAAKGGHLDCLTYAHER